MATEKEIALRAIQSLPENASLEAALEEIAYQIEVKKGLADIEAGNFVSHDDVVRKYLKDGDYLGAASGI